MFRPTSISEKYQHDLNNYIEVHPSNRINIIFEASDPHDIDIFSSRFSGAATNPIVYLSNLTNILMSINPAQSFKLMLLRHESIMPHQKSPFVASGAINDDISIFHGRKSVLEELQSNSASIICGGRRIGKTSVLNKVEEILSDRNYVCASVSTGHSTEDDQDLALALKIHAGCERALNSKSTINIPSTLTQFESYILSLITTMVLFINFLNTEIDIK